MTLEEAIKAHLDTVPGLTSGPQPLLPGGTYAQPLVLPEVQNDGNPANDETAASEYIYEATPRAFNLAVPNQARWCLTITTRPRGEVVANWDEMRLDVVDIDFYGPQNDPAGDTTLREAQALVKAALTSCYLRPYGSGCVVKPWPRAGYDIRNEPRLTWSVNARDVFVAAWF